MRRPALVLTLSASMLGLLPWTTSNAATLFTVNTTADAVDADSPGPFDGVCATAAGQCSLRAAIQEANQTVEPDEIIVPPGTYQLTLGPSGENASVSGDLDISVSVTIAGAGPGLTVIDGMQLDRVFHTGPTAQIVVLRDLTIQRGSESLGGGINSSTVTEFTVERVVLSGNTATSGPGGAAVFEKVTMTDTLITGNSSAGQGGGVIVGGDSVLTNVTATGNSTMHEGGGVSATGSGTDPVRLNAVTVTGNTADADGNGVGSFGGIQADFVVLTVENSVVAGNTDGSPGAEAPDCGGSGSTASGGNNLIGNGTGCGFTAQGTDQVGTGAVPIDPKLGPLADNGGPTMTHALLAGSPAIDAGGPDCPATDQRGLPRGPCDMGAYELVLCAKVPVNRIGTEGKDVLTGTAAADGFLALGGNDRISALGGNDGACAGGGKDRASGGGGKDRLLGEAGKDTLRGQGGKDQLKGGPGKDTCVGGGGSDKARCEEEKGIP